ncbi:MAG: prepilin-type N-terminal cleavage/methylation domain-containing protein [Patescibacteria group bacterium]
MKYKKGAGFTILELLVVVAIIAILSAVTLVLISATKERSRDAKRMSELRQLQTALNIYTAQVGRFPIAPSATPLSGTDPVSEALIDQDAIEAGPIDPLYPTYAYTYQTDAAGTSFSISFCLETDTIQGYTKGCGNIITP